MHHIQKPTIGTQYNSDGSWTFTVWAPVCESVVLSIVCPQARTVPLERDEWGYWSKTLHDVAPNAKYTFVINQGEPRPDPASMYQPHGPHKASQVWDHSTFKWNDNAWRCMPLSEMIMYELHVGTFTPQGTIEAILSKLDYISDIGINAIELMPISQFPGTRNWGYDGTYPFAVHNSYGTPDDLKRLVNECHSRGIAVILDVVYNHFGPEGCYLREFAPYYTHKYKTPWGEAINFDDAYSYGVRNFIIQNALYWLHEYHIDALRLDAIHGIYDMSAKHILQEVAEEVDALSQRTGRDVYLIAESDLNDSRIIRSIDDGGYGIDAQWADDFHHAVHAALTGESQGYYEGFETLNAIVASFNETFVFAGNYSSFRKRAHGNPVTDLSGDQFVVSIQNHDQIGNRMMGERLASLVSFDAQKLAAATMLLSPYVPLLFMGEEYGETNPFLYFISHSDEWLIDAVRKGRKEEFKSFGWQEDPPDPYSDETFERSKLDRDKHTTGSHAVMFAWYKQLITMRKNITALRSFERVNTHAWRAEDSEVILLKRQYHNSCIIGIMNFSEQAQSIVLDHDIPNIHKLLDSYDTQWGSVGKTLPPEINKTDNIDLNSYHFALYGTETI